MEIWHGNFVWELCMVIRYCNWYGNSVRTFGTDIWHRNPVWKSGMAIRDRKFGMDIWVWKLGIKIGYVNLY